MTIWEMAERIGLVQAITCGCFLLLILILGMRNFYKSIGTFFFSLFFTWFLMAIYWSLSSEILASHPRLGLLTAIFGGIFFAMIALVTGSAGGDKKKRKNRKRRRASGPS